MKYLITLGLVLLIGCGKESSNGDADYQRTSGPQPLVNLLAGMATSLMKENEVVITRVGEALPKDTEPLQLSAPKTKSFHVEKLLESYFGTDLVHIEYEIEYEYGSQWKGQGYYIPNVRFIPKGLTVDPLWSLKAVAVSDKPTNIATGGGPVAELRFGITFTAKGIGGTNAVTDEFIINARSGELKSIIREWKY